VQGWVPPLIKDHAGKWMVAPLAGIMGAIVFFLLSGFRGQNVRPPRKSPFVAGRITNMALGEL
jgi:hypothetical protein